VRAGRAVSGEVYITKEEVAKRLMKTARTVERWQRARYIPFVKVGQAVLYKWADIEARLDQKFGVGATREMAKS
jgi:excisionase family DNA binding protein